MSFTPDPARQPLYENLVNALNTLFGAHPGFRAAHAKGVVCEGVFTPAPGASALSRAAHLNAPSVPATVRFSNSTGIPVIPDHDAHATPVGMAIRFHASSGDTDIVAHSANGFPAGTAEEFLTFLQAVAASGPGAPEPTALQKFVGTHPNTQRFVQLPKPTPASFGTTSFFAANTFRFIDAGNGSRIGRYFIRPVAGEQHLTSAEAAGKSPNFLYEELAQRLSAGPIEFKLFLQLPNPGDPTHDASAVWPDDRKQVELGTLSIQKRKPDSNAAQKVLIFDPARLIDGLDFTDDPLPKDRAGVYSVSYSRRNP